MKTLFMLPLILALLFFLYFRGLISVKCTRSLYWVGTIFSASYKSCYGRIIRIIRPSESRNYLICFSSQLTKGTVRAELLDKNKVCLLVLEGHMNQELHLEQGEKYYLVLHLKNADGAHHFEMR